MQVRSLTQEDSLEEEMTTHFSILAWRIPWTEEPGGLQSMWLQSQTWLEQFSIHAGTCMVIVKITPPTPWQFWGGIRPKRSSLAIQWLELGAFTVMGPDSTLSWELRPHKQHGVIKKKKKKGQKSGQWLNSGKFLTLPWNSKNIPPTP